MNILAVFLIAFGVFNGIDTIRLGASTTKERFWHDFISRMFAFAFTAILIAVGVFLYK